MNLEGADPKPDPFDAHIRRVKKLALVAGVIGGMFGLCLSVMSLATLDHPSMRGVAAAPPVLGLIFAGMTMGCALLFAPKSFFNSEKGQACLKKIGTQSVAGARAVLLVCLLLGCGVITLAVLAVLQMAGVIEQPMRPPGPG